MTPERIDKLAKQANVSIRGHYDETGSTPAELQRFYELVRNEVLDEAAEVLYGHGLDLSMLQKLREEIRSMKK